MFLGVSTLTERGRSYRFMDDRIELRFLQQALRAVRKLDPDLRLVLFTDGDTHDAFPEFERVRVDSRGWSALGGRGANVRQAARRCGVDTVLAPLSCPLPPHHSFMQLLFLTDLLFLGPASGRNVARADRLSRNARRALRASGGVLCTSHALQKACASRLALGLERVYVAPPGVSEVFDKDLPPLAEPPYGVFPVNRYTLPCLPALREALKKRPELFPPLVVVIGPATPQEPDDWGCGTIRIERCPDAVLASLLHHADLLLYPAVDDGCGMAVAEALRSGTPVLTARTGAPSEWGGNVPAYCDPENATSIIQALRRFQDETPAERGDRLAMGRGAASEATWERCAWKLLAALKHT
jgi:glycosyltransferase involved in cell wall biosynthesis